MAKKKVQDNSGDPRPYDGPIERIDGVRPFNRYLWPTESWWANRELHQSYDSFYNFGIVALADGRFAVEGFVWAIEKNEWGGRKNVFATRNEALRSSAAALIRKGRYNIKGKQLADLVNWARNIVAKETGMPLPKPVKVKEEPVVPRKTGLPLLDYVNGV